MFYVDTALKLTECPTNIEVIITQVILAVPDNFGKSSVLVTHNRESAFSILQDQTWKMYYTDGNPHKTGYFSSLGQHSEI